MAPLRPPCSWGSRLAAPLQGSTVDAVRALVCEVHAALQVEDPNDDFFLHVLGTGVPPGKNLGVRVVVLAAYKLRQPHFDALRAIAACDDKPVAVRRLARLLRELDRQTIGEAFDATSAVARGGCVWLHDGGDWSTAEALIQEAKAWVACGATAAAVVEDAREQLRSAANSLERLARAHGPGSPRSWKWGHGTSLPDVFAADDAAREHRLITERVALFGLLAEELSKITV